ncbi:ATP-binding response regulator [Shewanella surugensis]|uniref:Response regulator n=1 Tax=Shewanella surugensis TaxID=212020 RepID=A0ABT0L9F4_9GAMM|nr:response regulator [Shewanella surugensis]MCL1124265.1 response regulator [Shewanella surugensis]
MKTSNHFIYTSIVLLVSSILLVITSIILFENNTKNNLTLSLLQKSNELILDTENLLLTLTACQENPCLKDDSQIMSIKKRLNNFKLMASRDKQSISLVGATEYSKLNIILDKYITVPSKTDTIRNLIPVLIEMQKKHNNIISKMKIEVNYKNKNKSIMIILFIIFILSSSLYFMFSIELKNKKLTYRINEKINDLKKVLSIIDDLNSNSSKSILNDLNISRQERKIYSKLKELHCKVESSKRNTDLSQQLYSMIGYEIRGITNIIKGGIQLLVHEHDDNSVDLARDVTIATTTLSNLAENYNELFSQGIKEKTEHYSFIHLLTEIIIHLSNKNNSKIFNIECDIKNNLPNELIGNPTKLFWILFLQLSNAISAQNNNNILIRVDSQTASDIAESMVIIELIFLTTLNVNIKKIDHLHWDKTQVNAMKNDEWSMSILDKVSSFSTCWYQSGKQQKFETKMSVTPISYSKKTPLLKGKFFLICADSELRINIMSNIFISHGARVKIARSPNDIFKSISTLALYDAIIITDTIEGIQLTSFCKTLYGKISKEKQTKLLLTVSSNEVAKNSAPYVDHIFYTPIIPDDFIPQVVSAIEIEEEKEEVNHQFLIVEDDRIQQFILKKILQQSEYDAEIVNGGLEAVNAVKSKQIDIIFMDCIMPGMGGIQATKLIRQYEKQNKTIIPSIIIGATALTSKSEHKVCLEAGMNYVISKPYKSDEILKTIKKYIYINDKRVS